jgi:hypothetical protein
LNPFHTHYFRTGLEIFSRYLALENMGHIHAMKKFMVMALQLSIKNKDEH